MQRTVINYKGHLLPDQKEISEVDYLTQIRNRKFINFKAHEVCFCSEQFEALD